jgi:adenine phosphoribosyltransferase
MDSKILAERLRTGFAWVGDGGTQGTLADRTGWLRDPELLAGIGAGLARLFPDDVPTVIFAPQSSGYTFAALVAQSTGAAFVGASKERKDLADSDRWLVATTPLDYLGRNMELSVRATLLGGSDRVLVVDDWAETGSQLRAMQALVEKAGARYLGAAVVVDALQDHQVRRALKLRALLNVREL